MELKIVPKEDALKDGCPLWICPAIAFSAWTKALDWSLNLQISRATYHTCAELSADLKELQEQWDVPDVSLTVEAGAPLMIATAGLLPAEKLVVVPLENQNSWLGESLSLWKDMGYPQTRLFLPDFFKRQSLKDWPPWADKTKLELVADVATTSEVYV